MLIVGAHSNCNAVGIRNSFCPCRSSLALLVRIKFCIVLNVHAVHLQAQIPAMTSPDECADTLLTLDHSMSSDMRLYITRCCSTLPGSLLLLVSTCKAHGASASSLAGHMVDKHHVSCFSTRNIRYAVQRTHVACRLVLAAFDSIQIVLQEGAFLKLDPGNSRGMQEADVR